MQQQSITLIIDELKYVCPFAEEFHHNFDGYCYWKDEEKKCDEYLKSKGKFKLWGIILPILGVIAFIFFVNFMIICWEDVTGVFSEWWSFLGLFLSVVSLVGAVIMFSTGIYMFVRGMILSPKKERYRKKAIENKDCFLAEIDRYKTSASFAECRRVYLSYFPNYKTTKEDIEFLIYAMQSSRAGSFKDALLLLDEKKHNDEMKAIAEKTMEYAKRAAEKPVSTTTNNYYYR